MTDVVVDNTSAVDDAVMAGLERLRPSDFETPSRSSAPDNKSATVEAALFNSPPELEQSPGANVVIGESIESPRKADRRVSWTTPQQAPATPPRHSERTPSTPPRNLKASPCRAPYATPPRNSLLSRMVHDPYKLKTPPPHKSPITRGNRTPNNNVRASPKPRTPTRTIMALQHQNTTVNTSFNSPGSVSLSPMPQNFSLSAAIYGTTTPSQNPSTPNFVRTLAGLQTPAQSVLSPVAATPQFTSQDPNLPPSLQPTSLNMSQGTASPQFDRQALESSLQMLDAMAQQLQGYMYAASAMNQLAQPFAYQALPMAGFQYVLPQALTLPAAAFVPQATVAAATAAVAATQPTATVATPQASVVPTFPTSTVAQGSQSGHIYVLGEFKQGRTVQFESPFFPQHGEYLVCEGDNGEDLCMCTHAWVGTSNSAPLVNNSLAANRNTSGNEVDPVTGDPVYPKIIRSATSKEVQTLHNAQATAEAKCIEVAKHKVLEHGLDMQIIDAEFQFDRKKLTFYYEADERIDFRELVRDLYKLYRARIWMSKVRSREGGSEQRSKGRSGSGSGPSSESTSTSSSNGNRDSRQ